MILAALKHWKLLLGGLAVVLLLAALAVQTARIEGLPIIGGGLKSSLAASERQSKAHFDAHVATITRYRAAQAEAARMEADSLLVEYLEVIGAADIVAAYKAITHPEQPS